MEVSSSEPLPLRNLSSAVATACTTSKDQFSNIIGYYFPHGI
jgi:hypothetical protein